MEHFKKFTIASSSTKCQHENGEHTICKLEQQFKNYILAFTLVHDKLTFFLGATEGHIDLNLFFNEKKGAYIYFLIAEDAIDTAIDINNLESEAGSDQRSHTSN